MRKLLLSFALVAAAAPAAVPVPPQSRWSTLPRLQLRPGAKASTAWIEKARALAKDGTCTFATTADGTTRLEIPFIVLTSPRGTVTAAEVADTGCAPLEAMVAGIAKTLRAVPLPAPKGAPPQWRYSRFVAGWRA